MLTKAEAIKVVDIVYKKVPHMRNEATKYTNGH